MENSQFPTLGTKKNRCNVLILTEMKKIIHSANKLLISYISYICYIGTKFAYSCRYGKEIYFESFLRHGEGAL